MSRQANQILPSASSSTVIIWKILCFVSFLHCIPTAKRESFFFTNSNNQESKQTSKQLVKQAGKKWTNGKANGEYFLSSPWRIPLWSGLLNKHPNAKYHKSAQNDSTEEEIIWSHHQQDTNHSALPIQLFACLSAYQYQSVCVCVCAFSLWYTPHHISSVVNWSCWIDYVFTNLILYSKRTKVDNIELGDLVDLPVRLLLIQWITCNVCFTAVKQLIKPRTPQANYIWRGPYLCCSRI